MELAGQLTLPHEQTKPWSAFCQTSPLPPPFVLSAGTAVASQGACTAVHLALGQAHVAGTHHWVSLVKTPHRILMSLTFLIACLCPNGCMAKHGPDHRRGAPEQGSQQGQSPSWYFHLQHSLKLVGELVLLLLSKQEEKIRVPLMSERVRNKETLTQDIPQ